MNTVRNLTQAYSQTPWRKQVMVIVLSLLFVVFATLVAGVYLSVTARAATMGREILLMQGDIDELELINADLTTQLAYITSASEMAERADVLGFEPVEKDQALFVMVPGYVRRGQLNLAPPPGLLTPVAARMPRGYSESLVDWFLQRILSAGKLLEN
jgi:cell division protein FtsL